MAAGNKNKRRQTARNRRKAFRDPKEKILIFCEGKNTEPNYFKAFKLVTATIKAIHIHEGSALAIVKEAIKQKEQNEKYKGYDQYWVVFDKDDTPNADFNDAIRIAKTEGFKPAYSNQAFEYWFLLHFNKYTGKINRNDYEHKLNNHGITDYDKSEAFSKKMYDLLYPLQAIAIKNAREVYESFDPAHSNPAQEESSTTVFKLVEELNKFI
ncbi:MAG: RloB domain-containing protein [Chlorobi bacterium]|nr:RloB domain-containing protein [Chlorobiota bacterium]